jgi:hypothetical protein
MKAMFLITVAAIAIANAFTPTSALARGSAASQDRKECENRCGLFSPQTAACYKKCDTKVDSKDKTTK